MKIHGWSIDGFGVFRDCAIADLPDGMTVLHGANEAGKSTLLEFVRRVLFGVPESTNGAAYPPLFGGRHCGRLLLADARGELVIERELDRPAAARVRWPDGQPADPSELPRLLGGADDRLFRSVFSFTLDDLRSLAALDGAGLRDALFSATLAGAGRSARAAAAALHGQAAARLDGGAPGQIGRLIAELHALRPRLNAARRAALGYADARAAAERLSAAIDARRAALAARRAARTRDDALLRAWPAWQALQAARAELAVLEPDAVSADAASRVHEARRRLDAATGALDTYRAAHQDTERQLASLAGCAASPELATEVESLAADVPLLRLQLATLPAARARAAEAEQLLHGRLQRAGEDWTVERIRRWTHAAIDRDRVREWQLRLRAAAERAQQAEWRRDAAASAAAAARRACERARADMPTGEAAQRDSVDRQRGTLTALRQAVDEMAVRRAQGEATAQTLHERERALRALDAQTPSPPPAFLATLLDVGAVASGGAAVWSLGQGGVPIGVGLGVLAVAAAGIGRWAAAQQRAHARREEERHLERRVLRSEMEAARRARDADWHRAAELAEEVARLAAAVGLSRTPSPGEIDARARALDEQAAGESRGERARARLAELERAVVQHEDEERARADELAIAAAGRDAIDGEWAAWRDANGFADALTPDDVLERIAALDAAQVALAAHDSAARELRHIEPLVAAWTRRATAVLEPADAAAAGLAPEALLERVIALRLQLQEQAPQRARRAELAQRLREQAGQIAAAEQEVARGRTALAEGLAACGVRDEAELIRRLAVAEHRATIERAVAEHERVAIERLGDAEAMAELATGAVDAWRRRAAHADAEIAALEQELYQHVAEQQQVRASCRALEDSAEVPTLEAEWAALHAELADAVREWRVLAAAEALVGAAQREFERTRQPGVLRAASDAFTMVTAGRYRRIVQDEAGRELLVVDRDGRQKPVAGALSRGTTEQLYISLRLGLAEELARRGIALPLVMDDVLVHFDPERARAMAEVLGAFARTHQVLFFTCHAATRDLLLEHGGAARLVEL